RPTVVRALELLKRDGWLESRQGYGPIVGGRAGGGAPKDRRGGAGRARGGGGAGARVRPARAGGGQSHPGAAAARNVSESAGAPHPGENRR
ncbi:hypothetical protein ACWGH9_30010, partial [Streptomyces chryseus]